MSSVIPLKAAAATQAPAEPEPARNAAEPPVSSLPDDRFDRMTEKLRPLVMRLVLPAITFAVVVAVWLFLHEHVAPELPPPSATWERAVEMLSEPFYDYGPNDKGVGYQVGYSLARVMAGFGLAVLVGVPVGFLLGMSPVFDRAWQPLIQILRPVSPLAWLPIGLLLFKAVNPSAIFVIFITCIWPTIVNTAAGVRAIPADYLNVARVLRLGRWETARHILLPAARPHIITGMRLSLSVAWMVIVAAEMLTGGIGIGFFVWDEWNNLNVKSIIVAIIIIGVIGMILEGLMTWVQNRFAYE